MINLALGLSKRGYQVEFFCYAAGDLLAQPLFEAGINVHWNLKSTRFSPGVLLALRNLLDRGKYDLALSFLPTPNFYAILAGRLRAQKRIPVIVSERRNDISKHVPLTKRLSRQFYRLANHVVTNSYHQKEALAQEYPWLKNKLSTIYNGFDLNYFVPGENHPNDHPLRILTIAHVTPYKNGICLVEALNLLKKLDGLMPHVDWIGQIVNKGQQWDYYNEMKRTILDNGLDGQWHWLNQRTDIVAQMQQHDVLVHPSFGEGLPNVVCEALACGLPVIVSNVLDHSRLVQDDKSGYLFDYKDPADLANRIKQFNNLSAEDRRKMGQNGREFATANLSIDRLTDEYENLFIKLLTKNTNETI